jgi:hypothetical protein
MQLLVKQAVRGPEPRNEVAGRAREMEEARRRLRV